MPMLVAMESPVSSWSVASISTVRLMLSTGAPANRGAWARPGWSAPPASVACSERVIVSGLYWKMTTLASGLKMSIPTIAPRTRRGEPGKVVIGDPRCPSEPLPTLQRAVPCTACHSRCCVIPSNRSPLLVLQGLGSVLDGERDPAAREIRQEDEVQLVRGPAPRRRRQSAGDPAGRVGGDPGREDAPEGAGQLGLVHGLPTLGHLVRQSLVT